jgi:hypothetical protein
MLAAHANDAGFSNELPPDADHRVASLHAKISRRDEMMTLGEVVQAAAAFAIVRSAFNWITDNYGHLADGPLRQTASHPFSLHWTRSIPPNDPQTAA